MHCVIWYQSLFGVTPLICQVNDSLKEQCILNGFGFVSDNNISITHLCKDGITFRGFMH